MGAPLIELQVYKGTRKAHRHQRLVNEIWLTPLDMDRQVQLSLYYEAVGVMQRHPYIAKQEEVAHGTVYTLVPPTDAQWLALCGKTAQELYEYLQYNSQFVGWQRKRTTYTLPLMHLRDAYYRLRPSKWDRMCKMHPDTAHLWTKLMVSDPDAYDIEYAPSVAVQRLPRVTKCSACGYEADDALWPKRKDLTDRPYNYMCPACKAVRTLDLLTEVLGPTAAYGFKDPVFTTRWQDDYQFWIGRPPICPPAQLRITRQPVPEDSPTNLADLPFLLLTTL